MRRMPGGDVQVVPGCAQDVAGRGRPRAIALTRKPSRVEEMIDRWRYRSWFAGKELSTDWTSGHFSTWRRMLSPLRDQPLRILEIGSWEGRSALFFLNFFPNSTIVCVDTFLGSNEEMHRHLLKREVAIEHRFDRNLSDYGRRVEKVKSRSAPALQHMIAEGQTFDLIYIDGDHTHDGVMSDSIGAWGLVAAGGIIIWDDYRYGHWLAPKDRPREAIDTFLHDHAGEFRLLAKGYQVAIERTSAIAR
jgi:predicted O-methyltransferase YrrM